MRKTPQKQNSPDILADIVKAMAGRSVLVIGDIMLDRFVYGDVNRISPESPVPVLTVKNETLMLGGAGNVLSNLAGLNVMTRLVSVVGDDREAGEIKDLIASRKAATDGLITDETRPTTVKTRFLASHQQLLRTDYEKAEPVTSAIEAKILQQAEAALEEAGAVILSDYGKGTLTDKVIAAIIKAARKRKIPVLVDPKGSDYSKYKGASVVTPNRKEIGEATGGLPTATDQNVTLAGQHLIEKTGVDAVLATRSQDGMSVIAKAAKGRGFDEPVHLRTEALEVFDVSGAGDTVIATVAAAMAAGGDLVEAAAIANVAGGIVVAKVGTTPIRQDELLAALDRKQWHRAGGTDKPMLTDRTREARLCGWDEAEETVRRWKARGLKIGFTNGCFDILHSGHVTYLNQARSRCDRLIIGLNADSSVTRLKGSSRPVNNHLSRAAVIGGLGSVDMVVLFGDTSEEDDKPVELIKKLQPDIFFKGGDYSEDQLPEAPVVKAYGGEVAIMSLVAGKSTTATIASLADEAA